jgi:hypothetical protein
VWQDGGDEVSVPTGPRSGKARRVGNNPCSIAMLTPIASSSNPILYGPRGTFGDHDCVGNAQARDLGSAPVSDSSRRVRHGDLGAAVTYGDSLHQSEDAPRWVSGGRHGRSYAAACRDRESGRPAPQPQPPARVSADNIRPVRRRSNLEDVAPGARSEQDSRESVTAAHCHTGGFLSRA